MDKEQQKQLITEIMSEDAKDGLYEKQTAVEWLIDQLEGDDSKIARVIGLKKYNSLIQQAKEMEKQQIVKAWDDADYAYFSSKETGIDFENGKEYYNEEYGGNK